MPELAKLWKEYESGERNSPDNGSGPTVEIRIPAEHATTNNRQVATQCSCEFVHFLINLSYRFIEKLKSSS